LERKQMIPETKQRILNSATQVFSDHGFDGARMDRIAEVAGVNKAAIYYHIGGKQKLYEAVLHSVFSNTIDLIADRVRSEDSPTRKMQVYIRSLQQAVADNPRIPPIMLRELASGNSRIPELLARDFSRLFTLLSSILQEGQKNRQFIPTPPLVLHLMVIGPVVLYSRLADIIDAFGELARKEGVDQFFTGNIGDVLEKLILNAISRNGIQDKQEHTQMIQGQDK